MHYTKEVKKSCFLRKRYLKLENRNEEFTAKKDNAMRKKKTGLKEKAGGCYKKTVQQNKSFMRGRAE